MLGLSTFLPRLSAGLSGAFFVSFSDVTRSSSLAIATGSGDSSDSLDDNAKEGSVVSATSEDEGAGVSAMERQCLRHPRFIKDLKQLETKTVNHPPYKNRKRVLLSKNEVPGVMQLAVTVLEDSFPAHKHENLFEAFYTMEGSGSFFNEREDEEGKKEVAYKANAGQLLHFPPRASHRGLPDAQPATPWRLLILAVAPRDGQAVTDFIAESTVEDETGGDVHVEAFHLKNATAKPMKDNEAITKRVLLGYNKLPNVLMFAASTLPAGQRNPKHVHKDAYEIYLITKGHGYMNLDGEKVEIGPDSFVLVPPNIEHGPIASDAEPLELLYSMIVVPEGLCREGISAQANTIKTGRKSRAKDL
ncbi:unnamed protein product [Amoebophrya sp. A25]|nr:unnamed protein product [Amoebophrya sp. A25]|eukprot:GSA25T00016127001.1